MDFIPDLFRQFSRWRQNKCLGFSLLRADFLNDWDTERSSFAGPCLRLPNYINSILALREAMDAGFEEALLLDNEGYVAEGSGENFFFVRDGVLYTPELTSCLEGITRDSILRIAADQGLTVREKRITRDEVYVADEAFFTGTAAEVVPVRELDNRMIGSGTRGPITEKLQAIYFEAVRGAQPDYAEWLAPVAD